MTSFARVLIMDRGGTPERVQALILYATLVRMTADGDVDWAFDADMRAGARSDSSTPGAPARPSSRSPPSHARDPRMRDWLACLQRLSPSGRAAPPARHLRRPGRPAAPARGVRPHPVLHRGEDELIDVRHSR
jgi:hypothetical protein